MSDLGRFETLSPTPKLTSLTATLDPKADITIGYVKVQINGDNRPVAVIHEALPRLLFHIKASADSTPAIATQSITKATASGTGVP
jgi:hypothetical protein